MSGFNLKSRLIPRVRNDIGPRQWRYALSIEKSGVILLTAKLTVYDAKGKALLWIKHRYTSFDFASRDVMETELVRRFFRYIGAG